MSSNHCSGCRKLVRNGPLPMSGLERLRKKAEGKHTTQMPNMLNIPFAASIALET